MKNFFRAILALIALACCTPKNCVETQARVKDEKKEKNEKKNDNKEESIPHITLEGFLDNIYDFKNDPEQKWVNKSQVPTVIDFYASWCAPCKKIAPSLEALSAEFKGKVNFYKVNAEEEERLAIAFNVQSLPTLMFIPKEGDPYLSIGYISKGEIKSIIKELVKY